MSQILTSLSILGSSILISATMFRINEINHERKSRSMKEVVVQKDTAYDVEDINDFLKESSGHNHVNINYLTLVPGHLGMSGVRYDKVWKELERRSIAVEIDGEYVYIVDTVDNTRLSTIHGLPGEVSVIMTAGESDYTLTVAFDLSGRPSFTSKSIIHTPSDYLYGINIHGLNKSIAKTGGEFTVTMSNSEEVYTFDVDTTATLTEEVTPDGVVHSLVFTSGKDNQEDTDCIKVTHIKLSDIDEITMSDGTIYYVPEYLDAYILVSGN